MKIPFFPTQEPKPTPESSSVAEIKTLANQKPDKSLFTTQKIAFYELQLRKLSGILSEETNSFKINYISDSMQQIQRQMEALSTPQARSIASKLSQKLTPLRNMFR